MTIIGKGSYVLDGEHRRRALEEVLKDIRTHDGQEDEE